MGKKILAGAVIGAGAMFTSPFTTRPCVSPEETIRLSLTYPFATGNTFLADIIIQKIKKNKEEILKRERQAGFDDGIKKGKAQAIKQVKMHYDFFLATAAISYYFARCDGYISKEEAFEIEHDLDAIHKMKLPKEIEKEFYKIENNENITFEEVKRYLDCIPVETLIKLKKDADEIINISDGICEAEKLAMEKFKNYLSERSK